MTHDTLRPGQRLTHMKGMPYQFLFFARHSETMEEFAVYECLYENPRGTLWIRPRAMFEESTTRPDGTVGRRFAPLRADDGTPVLSTGIGASQAQALASFFASQAQEAWEATRHAQGLDAKKAHLGAPDSHAGSALECAYASLALARLGGDANAVDEARRLVETLTHALEAVHSGRSTLSIL